ncbi:hypothetical protein [Streptomyces sp. RKAG337]|uniref:hypothetical protein n=1 Tax=Streptomyces sp. RKAG337 TaxID=2893404 RepID=UPI002033C16F|nr:hypothetical protein [Streptomyces sp. RKAG337]MCM2428508.1 hypothetical protein [Streptomyces sp. RKAG337]
MSADADERVLAVARGLGALGLLVVAAALIVAAGAGTTEAADPGAFPGIRANHAWSVLVLLVLGLAALLCAGLVARRTGRVARVVLAVAVAGLVLLGGRVAWEVAPMLGCGGADGLARQADGSYACYDR